MSLTDSNSNKRKKPVEGTYKEKVCIGDVVIVSVSIKASSKHKKDRKETKMEGTVMYIGTPKDRHHPRYGIVLPKPIGNMDGSLIKDPTRRYFVCKKNHGVLVLRNQIIEIKRSLVNVLVFLF